MDERALTELLECSVCLEQLDATSKVLQCQHTFCRRCLEEIVATKNELRCPECRMLVEMRVDELPSNILLIRLLEGLKNCKAGITGQASSANSSPSHTNPSSPGSAAGGARTSPIHKVSPFDRPLNHTTGFTNGGGKTNQNDKCLSGQVINTSQPCAKALYNYEAKEPGDLTFKKGDVILLRRQVDENWYHGELNGQHGFFPATYVQVITPLPQEIPKCKALYDFVISDKNEKDCLTFQKDEVLTVIRRVDDNWAEGKLGDRIGIFPISFVEMNDSAKWLINNQTQINARPNAVATPSQGSVGGSPSHVATTSVTATATSTSTSAASNNNVNPSSSTSSSSGTGDNGAAPASGSGVGGMNVLAVLSNPTVAAVQRVAGQKRHSLTCISSSSHKVAPHNLQQQRHSMELSGSLSLVPLLSGGSSSANSSPAKSSQAVAGASSSHESSNGSTSGHIGPNGLILYVALYNYKPQKDDEVELRKGDYYTVSEKCQDGWFKGTCLRSGNFGVFPGNYVQLVKISSKQTSSSVTRGAAPGAVVVGAMSNSSPSSSAAASTSGPSGSPSRQSQVAKVQQHVTVSRAHSFPKTSPLASMDYQVRAGQGGAGGSGSRTAQGTPTHTSRLTGANLPTPPRPITNPAVHGTPVRLVGGPRPTTSSSTASSSSCSGLTSTSSMAGTPSGSAHSSPAHAQHGRSSHSGLANGTPAGSPSSNGESRKSSHHSSSSGHHGHSSHGHSRNTGSPRSSRKSERSKHSSSASSAERMSSKHNCSSSSSMSCSAGSSGMTTSGHRSHSAEMPPHAPTRTPHSGVSASTPLHSMAANATLTPPNVVVGAVGGGDHPPPPPPAPREKEKKKDKDRLGLMKRLTKSKKSKSPPPDPATDGATSSEGVACHQRTGSCPANSIEGATAGVTPTHRKTSSLDAATSSGAGKGPRTKPLLRERFRCIVPYPPQSDIELELKVGDIVFVHKKREDGWYKGTLQRTGKTGLFPGSFVETF